MRGSVWFAIAQVSMWVYMFDMALLQCSSASSYCSWSTLHAVGAGDEGRHLSARCRDANPTMAWATDGSCWATHRANLSQTRFDEPPGSCLMVSRRKKSKAWLSTGLSWTWRLSMARKDLNGACGLRPRGAICTRAAPSCTCTVVRGGSYPW